MKINCTKCGKKFDGEQHMYICPKCNHYHSQVGLNRNMSVKKELPEMFEEMIDDFIEPDDGPEFIKTLNGDQTVYTEIRQKKESDDFVGAGDKLKKIGAALGIVIVFIVFITGNISEFYEGSSSDDSWGEPWDSMAIEVPYGDSIEFDSFTVNVGEIEEMDMEGLDTESDKKIVRIYFDAESPYTIEDDDIMSDVKLKYNTSDGYEDIVYASFEDDLTDDRQIEEQLYDEGLVVEAHYSGDHFWAFVVSEDAEELVLEIDSYIPEEGGAWGSYELDECFVMPIEL